jgi:hypothetical protein
LYGFVEQEGGDALRQLDLVGHGKQTHFLMGDVPLLESGKEPHRAFKRLKGVLPKKAEVRILGCLTGYQDEGLKMIQAASAALEGRKVVGTTIPLHDYDFDEGGLSGDFGHLIGPDGQPPAQPQDAVRSMLEGGELDTASKWQQFLPAGYQVIGRGEPLAVKDASVSREDATISFACDGHLVLIEDEPRRPPLLLQWHSSAPPPRLEDLKSAFQAQG